MISNEKILSIEMKAKLSALWIFVLLNIIFRDIHEIFRPGMLEEMMTGVVNGNQITEGLMLIGGIMIEIPIVMVPFTWLLKDGLNRWANIVASAFTIVSVIFAGPADLDDMFFAAIEIVALVTITWFAWRWQVPKQASPVTS
jgi:Sec-independent protein secretion pathway component TatC